MCYSSSEKRWNPCEKERSVLSQSLNRLIAMNNLKRRPFLVEVEAIFSFYSLSNCRYCISGLKVCIYELNASRILFHQTERKLIVTIPLLILFSFFLFFSNCVLF